MSMLVRSVTAPVLLLYPYMPRESFDFEGAFILRDFQRS